MRRDAWKERQYVDSDRSCDVALRIALPEDVGSSQLATIVNYTMCPVGRTRHPGQIRGNKLTRD